MSLERVVYTLEEQLRLLGQQLVQTDSRAPWKRNWPAWTRKNGPCSAAWGNGNWSCGRNGSASTTCKFGRPCCSRKSKALIKLDQGAEAYRLALELDQLRSAIPEAGKRIPALEQTIWSLQFRIRQLRRQRDTLKARLRTDA